MMKRFLIFTSFISLFSLSSCGECEDKTLQVSDNLANWLPYTIETDISFLDQNNQRLNYTISPNVSVRTLRDDDCSTTTIQPYIVMESIDQAKFLNVWLNRDEDLLGDRDQLWATLNENDQNIGSGAINNVGNPDLIATSVTLNGAIFNEVITLDLNKNSDFAMRIFLQKNIGLVGFEYEDSLWVIE